MQLFIFEYQYFCVSFDSCVCVWNICPSVSDDSLYDFMHNNFPGKKPGTAKIAVAKNIGVESRQ